MVKVYPDGKPEAEQMLKLNKSWCWCWCWCCCCCWCWCWGWWWSAFGLVDQSGIGCRSSLEYRAGYHLHPLITPPIKSSLTFGRFCNNPISHFCQKMGAGLSLTVSVVHIYLTKRRYVSVFIAPSLKDLLREKAKQTKFPWVIGSSINVVRNLRLVLNQFWFPISKINSYHRSPNFASWLFYWPFLIGLCISWSMQIPPR